MSAERRPSMAWSWRLYGLGVVALGVVAAALRDFLPGQPVPKGLPERAALAWAAAAFMLVAGAAVQWRRATVWAAGAITAYFGLLVVILMDGRMMRRNPTVYGAYSNTAEQLAIAAGALIVWAASARIDPRLAARSTRAGQLAFGVCVVLFGGAHFAYMELTAPLVPKWLPPSPEFWGYATGVFHIAGGLAILTGVKDRLAATLLTVMYAAFTPLVHIPVFLADPHSHTNWTENAMNLALTGAAWVVADSLARANGRRV